MTVLEKIKAAGGFADFGMIVSMPLGFYLDGTVATTQECFEVQKLKAENKLVKSGTIDNSKFKAYLTNRLINGDLLKCK